MTALLPWLSVVAGLVLLYFGGEWLVKGSARLALRLGLTPLVVGLTVVAFGTSSPELFVSLQAVLAGRGDIAIGNVVGSNIGNIGLILAICALVFPLRVAMQILRVDMPVLLVVSLALCLVLLDGAVARWEAALLLAGLVAYLVFVIRLARREGQPEVRAEFEESMPEPGGSLALDLATVVAGLVLLGFGARFLVDGATEIARAVGMSEVVIGLTIVAVGTSLPELSASLVAALRKEGDIAVGNIVGSNLFNILGIVGMAGLVQPFAAAGIAPLDLIVMIGFALVLLPLMKTGFTIQRWEGALLLAGYVGYLAWLLLRPAAA